MPGINWVTGDAINLASSARLWPHVAPPPENARVYTETPYIQDAFLDFHWMGEDAMAARTPEEREAARIAAIGRGNLRDPRIREKCVCPMTDCDFFVRAYTFKVEPPKIPIRIQRPVPAGVNETQTARAIREELNRQD